ncbi:MAG TPA: NAD(+)/NADH kinase [Chthoniobacterales bacterium]
MTGLIAHTEKPGAAELVRAVAAEFSRRGAELLFEAETAQVAGFSSTLSERDLAARCDLLLVLGGDGSILRLLHRLEGNSPAIFGINLGSLGFLTCLGATEYAEAVDSILARNYVHSPRTLLEVRHGGKALLALNDVVISRGERSRLVKTRVRIDGQTLTEYNADGLIISTPTGSTAYSLSSGGPILMPESGAFVVTPICPHVLTNRSVVVSDESVIEAELLVEGQQVFATVDGQAFFEIQVGERLILQKSSRRLELAMLPGRSFSDVLRQKLKWSGSNV